jgi:hypothetical protein
MKVDRARFLLLTAALTAATAGGAMATGCTIKSADTGGTIPAPGVDSGGSDGGADAYYGDAADAAACLTDDGTAPTCEGADVSCSTLCQSYVANYKKGVAREITDCIIKLPTCEGADTAIAACVQSGLGKACEDTTAAEFCGPVVESCLNDASTSSLDLKLCTELATGLNTTGRDAFTTCITDVETGYCKADPGSCFATLK